MKEYINNIKNKKGFTLIELLAVIVILALLVLIATPIIQRVIANSQKNTFKDEVQSLAKYLDTAYADYQMDPSSSLSVDEDNNDFKITYNPKTTSEPESIVVCATIDGLVNKGYVKKADTSTWGGYILTNIPLGAGGSSETEYNISNGKFKASGANDSLSIEQGTIDKTTKCP